MYKIFLYDKQAQEVFKVASAVESWNKIKKQLKNTLLKDLFSNILKRFVSNLYLKSY